MKWLMRWRKKRDVIQWVHVRVEDNSDELEIHEDDMKKWGLEYDHFYEGHFMPDGSYRIAIPATASRAALQKEEGE